MLLYDNTIFSLNETQSAIRDFLSNISGAVILSEELEFKIKIILNELVTNCFKHDKASSYVRVLAKPRGNFISIVVMDDGLGFDFSAALQTFNISEETSVFGESGRGLHIVSILSDVLRYNRRGNVIAIKVNLV